VLQFTIAFFFINAVLLLFLPRRLAPLPLLAGACYMTMGQGIEVGPFSFHFIRMLTGVGIIRLVIRGERPVGGFISLDWLMILWAVWALMSSVFHNPVSDALVFRLGVVYNACGVYFLLRCLCTSLDDIVSISRIMAIVLVPVAVAMLAERVTLFNPFSIFGGVQQFPTIRQGVVRAQGPFAHSILAGTAGAVCFPICVALWRSHLKTSILGGIACVIIVLMSGSSGPFLTLFLGLGALLMWRWRYHMRAVRWAALVGYLGLDIVMKAPAYYIIARIDAAGTGWHRARLIESSIEHLNEWWLGGTDFTRHWMPTGVTHSPDHADITNHYIKLGVWGGLPLMFLFIGMLVTAFGYVGKIVTSASGLEQRSKFFVWAFGASLFAHAATCISVSYFDQTFVFLYLTLAVIASARSATVSSAETAYSRSPAGAGSMNQSVSADPLGC
jgi:hypothetical protein